MVSDVMASECHCTLKEVCFGGVWWSVHGLEKFSEMRQNERRGEFIRVGDAQLKGEPLCELVANLYSLKTKKIPTGRLALGHWLGCYRVSDGWVFHLIFHQGTGWFRSRGSRQQLLQCLVISGNFCPMTLV